MCVYHRRRMVSGDRSKGKGRHTSVWGAAFISYLADLIKLLNTITNSPIHIEPPPSPRSYYTPVCCYVRLGDNSDFSSKRPGTY